MPKPNISTSKMVGMPRTTSAYTTASKRSGVKIGPLNPRTTASARPMTKMTGSAVTKSSTVSLRPSRMSGRTSSAYSALKNDSRTAGHPGDVTSSTPRVPSTTTELSAEMLTLRR